MSLSLVQVPAKVEGLPVSNKINFNRDKICALCGKPTKRLCTHHVIPRYLSISSDDDVMEACVSCHRKMDTIWHNLLLWNQMKAPNWINKSKARKTIKAWEKRNKKKVLKYRQEWSIKKRREQGIPERMLITSRYEDLEVFKKELIYLYNQGLSWRQVAKELGLSQSCVNRWSKIFNIKSRPRAEAVALRFRKFGRKVRE